MFWVKVIMSLEGKELLKHWCVSFPWLTLFYVKVLWDYVFVGWRGFISNQWCKQFFFLGFSFGLFKCFFLSLSLRNPEFCIKKAQICCRCINPLNASVARQLTGFCMRPTLAFNGSIWLSCSHRRRSQCSLK